MRNSDRVTAMQERRKKADRRTSDKTQDRIDKCNRRISPDRRLNNISVEWIPFNHIHIHPLTRTVFNGTKHSV